jgi:hypothetical protein
MATLFIVWIVLAVIVAVWFGFIVCGMRKDRHPDGDKHERH